MEAGASAMAVCDIGQCEPAALLLSDLAFSLAGRPPRWSIWPTRRQAVHGSDDKPVKGMNVSDADRDPVAQIGCAERLFLPKAVDRGGESRRSAKRPNSGPSRGDIVSPQAFAPAFRPYHDERNS